MSFVKDFKVAHSINVWKIGKFPNNQLLVVAKMKSTTDYQLGKKSPKN